MTNRPHHKLHWMQPVGYAIQLSSSVKRDGLGYQLNQTFGSVIQTPGFHRTRPTEKITSGVVLSRRKRKLFPLFSQYLVDRQILIVGPRGDDHSVAVLPNRYGAPSIDRLYMNMVGATLINVCPGSMNHDGLNSP